MDVVGRLKTLADSATPGVAVACSLASACSSIGLAPSPRCVDPAAFNVISEHSLTYLPCFDHPHDWDNANFDAVSSALSVVQVEVAEDGLILTGWMPDTATVTTLSRE